MHEHVWAVCERVTEAQAVLNDHAHGRMTSAEVVSKLDALFAEEGLLRSLHEVGHFLVPPPVMLSDA